MEQGVRVPVLLFGSLAVDLGGQRLGPKDLGGIKPRRLFEILLVNRGRPVPKERLADLLWGDRPPQNVAGTLETYVSVLRRHLGEARGVVVTQDQAYAIDRQRAALDLDRFDALIERAASAKHHRRSHLEDALALVRGEVLENEPYSDWAIDIRDQYRQVATGARLEAGHLALAEGETRAALVHAERALQEEPLDERAHRLLILGLYLVGVKYEALDAYRRCRARLADELGLDPSEETEELHRAVLQDEPDERMRERFVRAEGGQRHARSAPPRAVLTRDDMHVLLVEDSPTDTRLVAEALDSGSLPVQLHVAGDGEEAIAFLRQRPPFEGSPRPDLILLDLNLPGMDGRDVLALVKSDPQLRAIPVVVLTSSDAQQDVLRSYDLHANSYVTKPGDPEDFAAVIRAIETYWPVTTPLRRE